MICVSLSLYIYLHAHSYARVSLCTLRFDMNRHRQKRWISRCFLSGTSATAADLCRCAPLEGPKFHRESWDAKSLVYPVDMLCLPRDMEQNPPGDKDSRDNLGMFPKGYDQFKPLMGDITQFPFQCEKWWEAMGFWWYPWLLNGWLAQAIQLRPLLMLEGNPRQQQTGVTWIGCWTKMGCTSPRIGRLFTDSGLWRDLLDVHKVSCFDACLDLSRMLHCS